MLREPKIDTAAPVAPVVSAVVVVVVVVPDPSEVAFADSWFTTSTVTPSVLHCSSDGSVALDEKVISAHWWLLASILCWH